MRVSIGVLIVILFLAIGLSSRPSAAAPPSTLATSIAHFVGAVESKRIRSLDDLLEMFSNEGFACHGTSAAAVECDRNGESWKRDNIARATIDWRTGGAGEHSSMGVVTFSLIADKSRTIKSLGNELMATLAERKPVVRGMHESAMSSCPMLFSKRPVRNSANAIVIIGLDDYSDRECLSEATYIQIEMINIER